MQLFERAAEAGGQLLRVDCAPGGSGSGAAAILFTFDVGRILVGVEAGKLTATHLENPEDVPEGLVDAAEDEPWWRLLGTPLSRAEGSEDGGQLRLTYKTAPDRPRVVCLTCNGGHVRAFLENGH